MSFAGCQVTTSMPINVIASSVRQSGSRFPQPHDLKAFWAFRRCQNDWIKSFGFGNVSLNAILKLFHVEKVF